MRLDLSPEQEMVRDTARRFLEKEAPLSRIRAQFDQREGFSRAYWSQAAELGWTILGIPEDAGGFSPSGMPGQDLAIVSEEIGRLVGAGPFQPTSTCVLALTDSENAVQRDALLPGLISGEQIAGWAFGERMNIWTPERFSTRVTAGGQELRLSGAKAYVEAGAEADVFIVTARGDNGLVQMVVPRDARGLSVTPGRSVDFTRRFAELLFENVRVPRSAVLYESTAAAAAVERQLQLALLLQCAETNGAVERCFEFTVDYMRQRYAFDRPIASFQALKHRLADTLLHIHSCMATTDAALEAFDACSPAAQRLARIAKAYVADKATIIMGELVQMTGGIAVTWDHDLHLYERRIAVNRAILGTPEHHQSAVLRLISEDRGNDDAEPRH